MRGKSMLAFALAIGCGLVAMVGVQQALQNKKQDQDVDKVSVFVAAAEIQPGQTIDLNMLERRKFLRESVPPEAVTDVKQLEKRALTAKAMPGEIIRIDKLGAEGKTGASISIPVGMRTVTIPTTTTQAHSGMMQPGDRVDVMVTYRVQPPAGGREYPETKTIMGNVAVFATDAERDANSGAEGAKGTMKNVSLLVTPEQAQIMTMAQSFGTICLALRNAGDNKEVEITNLTPDLFRNTNVLNNAGDNPKPQPLPRADTKQELDNFLDDAAGKTTTTTVATKQANTETWEIAFYRKDGVTIEALEVPLREEGATKEPANKDANDKSVMGALMNLLNAPSARPAAKQGKPEAKQNQSEQKQSAAGSDRAKASSTDGQPVVVQAPTTAVKSSTPPKAKSTAKLKPSPTPVKVPVTKAADKK